MSKTNLASVILSSLSKHRGRASAMRREDVLFDVHAYWPNLSDRAFSDAYSALPVCSTSNAPFGLYLPASRVEIDDFLREYACHTNPAKVRAREAVFRKAYPQWYCEDKQMELPL